MARFSLEIGDDLRDLRNPPAEDTEEAEPEGYLTAQIADAVLEVPLHPSHTPIDLLIS